MMMSNHKSIHRLIFRSSLLGACFVFCTDIMAQVGAPAAATNAAATSPIATPAQTPAAVANGALDPRVIEAQRRRALSHKRRMEEIEENAKNAEMLTASEPSPVPDLTRQRRHRVASTHRSTTAEGRRAATRPAVNPVNPATATQAGP